MLKMLIFDPNKRITAAQALKHPFFEGLVENPSAQKLVEENANTQN